MKMIINKKLNQLINKNLLPKNLIYQIRKIMILNSNKSILPLQKNLNKVNLKLKQICKSLETNPNLQGEIICKLNLKPQKGSPLKSPNKQWPKVGKCFYNRTEKHPKFFLKPKDRKISCQQTQLKDSWKKLKDPLWLLLTNCMIWMKKKV